MFCGWRGQPISDPGDMFAIAAGLFAAAAMGVQNAASRLVYGELAPTTVMTGNVTQLVIDSVDVLRGAADAAVKQRFEKFLWPIVAFGTGAICGAFAGVHLSLWALALPAAILLLLASAEPNSVK
jgi:uncharacterized membrane protein YoaK (UPF0700 family)